MEIRVYDFEIDDFNAAEMAEHAVDPAEVYEVLDSGNWTLRRNGGSGAATQPYIMVGRTDAGRWLNIPIQPISERDGLWRPATAFTP